MSNQGRAREGHLRHKQQLSSSFGQGPKKNNRQLEIGAHDQQTLVSKVSTPKHLKQIN